MKKVLFTLAALGLAVGLTATVASAASFSATGKVNFTGIYVSDGGDTGDGSTGLVGNNEANDFVHYSFYMYPTVMVNDNISVKGEFRLIDRETYGNSHNETNAIKRLWMEYMSPIGKWRLGRQTAGPWGTTWMNSTGFADRIIWNPSFMPENLALTVLWQKITEGDANNPLSDEADVADWYAGISHKGAMGTTQFAINHYRYDEDAGDRDQTQFRFAGSYKLNAFNIEGEILYDTGEAASSTALLHDVSSWGAYVNATTQMDNLTVGGMFWYLQGDDDPLDDDNEGFTSRGGTGNDFNPFLIGTGDYFSVLNKDKGAYLNGATSGLGDDNPGSMAAAVYGVLKTSDKLSFNAALGHVWADAPEALGLSDDEMGLEIDLGMTYKLMDNLSYTAQFGYLKVGNMIEEVADLTGEGENDIFALLHSLTMTF
jgi:hypothetical protein